MLLWLCCCVNRQATSVSKNVRRIFLVDRKDRPYNLTLNVCKIFFGWPKDPSNWIFSILNFSRPFDVRQTDERNWNVSLPACLSVVLFLHRLLPIIALRQLILLCLSVCMLLSAIPLDVRHTYFDQPWYIQEHFHYYYCCCHWQQRALVHHVELLVDNIGLPLSLQEGEPWPRWVLQQ